MYWKSLHQVVTSPVVIPKSDKHQEKQEDPRFWFPYCFKIYFNFTYGLLLSPFRMATGNDSVTRIQVNPFQKWACYTLHGIFTVLSFIETSRISFLFTAHNPYNVFHMLLIISYNFQANSVTQAFRSKKKIFLEICNVPSKEFGSSLKQQLVVMIPMVFLCTLEVVLAIWDHVDLLGYFSTTHRFQRFLNDHKFLFNIKSSWVKNSTVLEVNLDLVTYGFWNSVWVIWWLYLKLLTWYGQLFSLLSAMAIYEVIAKYSSLSRLPCLGQQREFVRQVKIVKSVSQETERKHEGLFNFSLAFMEYEKMKALISKINAGTSGICLWTYLLLIFVISVILVFIVNASSTIPQRLLFAMWIGHYPLISIVASEAFRKGEQYKEVLMKLSSSSHLDQQGDMQSINTISTLFYMQATSYRVGQMGGGYFTMTYQFLGITMSVVLTYVLVVVQFLPQQE